MKRGAIVSWRGKTAFPLFLDQSRWSEETVLVFRYTCINWTVDCSACNIIQIATAHHWFFDVRERHFCSWTVAFLQANAALDFCTRWHWSLTQSALLSSALALLISRRSADSPAPVIQLASLAPPPSHTLGTRVVPLSLRSDCHSDSPA